MRVLEAVVFIEQVGVRIIAEIAEILFIERFDYRVGYRMLPAKSYQYCVRIFLFIDSTAS